MKISEIKKQELPISGVLTSGYTAEESLDPKSNCSIVKIDDMEHGYYRVHVFMTEEQVKYNETICSKDWHNPATGKYDLSFFEANPKERYKTTLYVGEEDDFFESDAPKKMFITYNGNKTEYEGARIHKIPFFGRYGHLFVDAFDNKVKCIFTGDDDIQEIPDCVVTFE